MIYQNNLIKHSEWLKNLQNKEGNDMKPGTKYWINENLSGSCSFVGSMTFDGGWSFWIDALSVNLYQGEEILEKALVLERIIKNKLINY